MPTYSSPARGWSFIDSTYTRTDVPGTQVFQRSAGHVQFGTNERVTNSDPDWRVKLARRSDATNNYSRKEWLRMHSYLVHCTSRTITPSYRVYGESHSSHFGGGYALKFSGEDTALRDEALRRIKNRLNGHYGKTDAIVPTVELRELRKTISGTGKMATDLLHSLISIRKTHGASAVKYASEAWLNFSFGVKPLVNDIATIALSIQDYLDRKDHTAKIAGTASKDWFSSLKETGEPSAYGVSISTATTAHHKLSYRYIGGFDIAVEAANNYGISDHLGLEFESLPSVAWELIPYSWVVDYFTNVGAFFDDTFVVPSGATKFLMLDRRYTMNLQIIPRLVPSVGTDVTSQSIFEQGNGFYFEFSRTRLGALPRIGLHFRSLDATGGYAINKLLNLASVLVSGSRALRL